jgi:ElaB/YqjD/DUF883 family membrane-anchored ribosome-binding protein
MTDQSREELEDRGRHLMDAAGDTAARAGASVQKGVRRLSRRAQSMAQGAGDKVEEYTGRPLESWTATARELVRERPLQAIGITLALGYLVGKLMARD